MVVYHVGSPQIYIPPVTTSVTRGSLLSLTCLMNGRPTPTVTWSKNNVTLTQDSRITVRCEYINLLIVWSIHASTHRLHKSFPRQPFFYFFWTHDRCEPWVQWLVYTHLCWSPVRSLWQRTATLICDATEPSWIFWPVFHEVSHFQPFRTSLSSLILHL